jgi:DivIVA domain
MTATLLLVLVVVLVIGGLVYGVVSLLSGDDPGLVPAEPDGRARPLPNDRSLHEEDLKEIRFDIALRGYRMSQVDRMLRRVAYDLGYKDEMIAVLEAEVAALREGRLEDAELLRKAREAASTPERDTAPDPGAGPGESVVDLGEAGPADESPDGADGPDRPEAVVAPDRPETEGQPDLTDATAAPDRPEAAEPELPREGSLRRREPVAVDTLDAAPNEGVAASQATADGAANEDTADTPLTDPPRAGEDTGDRAPVDGADRPAHA